MSGVVASGNMYELAYRASCARLSELLRILVWVELLAEISVCLLNFTLRGIFLESK